MAPTSGETKRTVLRANYVTTKESRAFEYDLPSMSARPPTAEKTAYLSTLRSSVISLQQELNTFLTVKMEEDKATSTVVAGEVDEQKAEQNYGEEVVEEDE